MKNKGKRQKKQTKIDAIGITNDVVTGRGGMALFSRYLCGIGILEYLSRAFLPLRIRKSGIPVVELFKQVICYFIEGSSRNLTYFNTLQKDAGYASAIETSPEEMCSSHTIKRFVKKIFFPRIFSLRRILQKRFIHRLNLSNPSVILLGIDTMVMDNDDANCRQVVKPCYKKVKGFQPLQMYWGGRIVDAVFRGGDKHSNHSDTTEKMIRHMVKRIRKGYDPDVPIIIRMDSGFFDQKLFKLCEALGVYYICGGKQYADIQEYISCFEKDEWKRYSRHGNKKDAWEYIEFMDRRESWEQERRAFYCRHITTETGQCVFDFARRDTVIYTNLGMEPELDKQLIKAGLGELIDSEKVIESYHQRGSDELANRGLKDFHAEQLPFERFESNMFWYYMILISFFLMENYKEDIACSFVSKSAYAMTVRRNLIDFAAKIVRHAGKIILKVTQTTWETLDLPQLWRRTGSPPVFAW